MPYSTVAVFFFFSWYVWMFATNASSKRDRKIIFPLVEKTAITIGWKQLAMCAINIHINLISREYRKDVQRVSSISSRDALFDYGGYSVTPSKSIKIFQHLQMEPKIWTQIKFISYFLSCFGQASVEFSSINFSKLFHLDDCFLFSLLCSTRVFIIHLWSLFMSA